MTDRKQLISCENTIEDLVRFVKFYAGEGEPEYKIAWDELPDYLPPELKIIYHEFGNYPSHVQWASDGLSLPLDEGTDTNHLFHNQDALVYFQHIEVENDRVAFAWENQGNWTAETEINKSDPPVYSNAEAEMPNGKVCEKLSHFLATLCLQELIFGSIYRCHAKNQEEYDEFIRNSQPVWMNATYIPPDRTCDFYLTPNNHLVMDGGDYVYSFIGSNNNEDCENCRQQIG